MDLSNECSLSISRNYRELICQKEDEQVRAGKKQQVNVKMITQADD